MPNYRKFIVIDFFGFFFFVTDRLLKNFAINNPDVGFCRGYFKFQRNYDLALSLPLRQNFIFILIFLIIMVLFFFLVKAYRENDFFSAAVWTFVILGAISNFGDRVVYGFVIDYINVPFLTVFNLADAMIVAGIGALAIKILKNEGQYF